MRVRTKENMVLEVLEMEDVLSQILTELNSLKESIGRIEEGLKRMNCSGQATVGVSRHCEEEYGVENKVVYASTLENLDYIWRKVLDTIRMQVYFID